MHALRGAVGHSNLLLGTIGLVLFVSGLVLVHSKGTETLRFDDDFKEFDLSKWKHEITMGGGGNWEFQMYQNSRRNSYVKDGVLYFKPTLTADLIGEDKVRGGHRMDIWGSQPADLCTGNAWWGCERTSTPANILNPITSARLRTAETFTFKYGRVEVRAKLPLGDWLWPAIWMMPVHNSYGQWPASGEIDICESRGNVAPGYGVDTYSSTLHWGPTFETNGFKLTSKTLSLPTGEKFSDKFHTFGLYWDEEQLYTYLDDPKNVVFSIKFTTSFWDRGRKSAPTWQTEKNLFNPWRGREANAAPFDQEFFLILNLAVGGTMNYFPDGLAGKPWTDKSPTAARDFYNAKSQWFNTWKEDAATLAIDSVKIWTFPNSVFHYPRGNLTLAQRVASLEADPPIVATTNRTANVSGAVQKAITVFDLPAALEASSADAGESVPFLIMSIVALVVAIATLAATGIIGFWARQKVKELQAHIDSQASAPPTQTVTVESLSPTNASSPQQSADTK
jgi:beta-glucanase (GH16 family)